jgi:membrane protease YdiL (CAAX protease family)
MNKKLIIPILLTLIVAFMEISGLPSVALFDISFKDVDPFIFPLMVNFLMIGIIVAIAFKMLSIDFSLGFKKAGLKAGLKKYAWIGVVAGILSFVAFFVGLYPFNYRPTIWKIIFEGIVYYIGVGIIEELYVRGLFLNILENLFKNRQNKTQIAIMISSIVFGLGHVPGMIGMGVFVIAFKVISTIGMGLYFGMIYKKTSNLWVPIIMHTFIDICALPYCFTTYKGYPDISLGILVCIYVLLGGYSIYAISHRVAEK